MRFSIGVGQQVIYRGANYTLAYRGRQLIVIEPNDDFGKSVPLTLHDAEVAYLQGELKEVLDKLNLNDSQLSLMLQFMPPSHREEIFYRYAFVRGFTARPVTRIEQENYALEIAQLNGFKDVPPIGTIRDWVTKYKKAVKKNQSNPLMVLFDHRHALPNFSEPQETNHE